MTTERVDAIDAPALPPDGAKAFGFASGLETDLNGIDMLVDALRLIAEGTDDRETGNALHAICNAVGRCLDAAKEKQREIYHLTWGYGPGARP